MSQFRAASRALQEFGGLVDITKFLEYFWGLTFGSCRAPTVFGPWQVLSPKSEARILDTIPSLLRTIVSNSYPGVASRLWRGFVENSGAACAGWRPTNYKP